MFKISSEKKVRWPVTVKIPADGGRYTKEAFQVEFDLIDQPRIDAIMEAAERPTSVDVAFLREVVTGWTGVRDEGDAEVSFAPEALERLLAIPYVRNAMVGAFFDCISGGRRGN